jgi:transcriptional regulator with XRE-family HTH domain
MSVTDVTVSRLPSRIGRSVRELREMREMGQTELAVILGTKQSAVSRIEAGSGANMRLSTLEQLAWALGCELVVELRPRTGA